MFGNSRGWIMSGVIIVLVGLLIYAGSRPPGISPPTGKFAKFRDSAALSVEPVSLGIKRGEESCDAGDQYRRVIEDYKANKFRYENHYDKAPDAAKQLERDKPQVVQWVVEAANCSKATLFGKNPAEVVNYDNNLDAIQALNAVGNWANTIAAVYISQKKYDEARPYLKGAFLLGQTMYYERLRWEEYFRGTELMNGAANGFARIAQAEHDDARAQQFAAFTVAMEDYEKKVTPLWEAISTAGSGREGETLEYAGDIFDFAFNAQEPMWRTEAILKLGRMKYMKYMEVGDQSGARRVLKDMADKPDLGPGPKAAAAAARDLTVENFRKFGGGA